MDYKISGIILAGGESKRFSGTVKGNILVGKKTIISRIIDIIGGIFNEIIIVTNTPEEYMKYENCKIVGDIYLQKGPLGGIHAGLKASANDAGFVFAGDMPLLEKNLIARQIEFYNSNNYEVLIPRVNSYTEPLHAIYNISVTDILEDFLGRNKSFAVRDFIGMVNAGYLYLGSSDETEKAFTNINCPDDILRVEKILGEI